MIALEKARAYLEELGLTEVASIFKRGPRKASRCW